MESSCIHDRVALSRAIETDWSTVVPGGVGKLVDICSDGLGTSREAFFLPLLTSTAAVLGHNATIALNDFWFEAPVVWTAVLADDMCRKKSAVAAFFTRTLKDVEIHVNAQQIFTVSHDQTPAGVQGAQTVIEQVSDYDFSVETLAERVRERVAGGGGFLISKDLQRVYGPLSPAASDVKIPGLADKLPCRDGVDQEKVKKHREAFMELSSGANPFGTETRDASFNLTGFVHPNHGLALVDTFPGFLESTVAIVCGKPRKVYHTQPVGTTGPLLAPIFLKIFQEHTALKTYTLDEAANAAFASYHNDVEERLERMSSEERVMRRVLSKSQGHVARLALVLHCLNHVVDHTLEQREAPVVKFEPLELIPTQISVGIMYNAINLVRLCIRHKMALIKPAPPVAKAPQFRSPADVVTSVTPRSAPVQNQVALVTDSRSLRQPPNVAGNRQENITAQMERFIPVQNYAQARSGGSPVSPTVRAVQQPKQGVTGRPGGGISPDVMPYVVHHRAAPAAQQMATNEQQGSLRQGTKGGSNTSGMAGAAHSQAQPMPVSVSMEVDGPRIASVTYNSQGSSVPAHISTSLVTLQQSAREKEAQLRVKRLMGAASVGSVHRPPRPSSNMLIASKLQARAMARVTPGASKALGRRGMKRCQRPLPIDTKYPSVADFKDFMVKFPIDTKYPSVADFKDFMVKFPMKVKRILTYGLPQLDSIYVAQRKLLPPVLVDDPKGGRKILKYPTNAARAFLSALAEAGLGEMFSRSGSRTGKSTFRKKRFKDLSPAAVEMLTQLNVTEQQYCFIDRSMISK